MAYEKVEVNATGRGCDKAALKQVETSGGLSAKGYIPVMAIGDEVIRESSVCVQRVADLAGAALRPDDAELAATLIKLCNALPKQTSSREIDELLRKCDEAVSTRAFLAGATLSVADVNLLPFVQRVEEDIPADATHLRRSTRARATPAFSEDGRPVVVVVVVTLPSFLRCSYTASTASSLTVNGKMPRCRSVLKILLAASLVEREHEPDLEHLGGPQHVAAHRLAAHRRDKAP